MSTNYLIERILGNNGLVVTNKQKEEFILFDRGIGFQKKIGDQIDSKETTKVYRLQTVKNKNIQNLMDAIDPFYFELASDIIDLAKKQFSYVDEGIILALADHLAFSIERLKGGMVIQNPLATDIKLLFEEAYQVALKAKDLISQQLGIVLPDDEVSFIALHINSAVTTHHIVDSLMVATIVRESILSIESDFDIKISEDSISFARLMNHMKYLLIRMRKQEKIAVDVGAFVKEQFPYSYQTATTICKQLSKTFNQPLNDNEISYLAIHIERIKTDELEKKWHHLNEQDKRK